MDDTGRPLRTIGRDAVVYELRTPSGRIVALRCFLHADPKRDAALAAQYAELGGDHDLERLRGASGPLPRSIRWVDEGVVLPAPDLHAMTVPIVAMERVPGRTLARTVDRLCRERQTEPLVLLADGWLATMTLLEEAGFSHGDLAADNLIVRPDGTMALVDLDTAAWRSAPVPALTTEGTPGYAHPRGAARTVARRDRFPALILWASLRALTRHPQLRERWGDPAETPGAALLWTFDDLRSPARSPLFAALEALHDETLAPMIEIVHRAIRFAADETPPLTEIAERLAEHGSAPITPSAPAVAPPAAPLFEEPDDGWSTGDAPSWPRPGEREGRTPDASRTTTLSERDRRRGIARQIAAAVAARDTAAAVRLWDESRSIPEVATYAASVHLLVSHDATAAIDRATRRKDDEGLVTAVAQAELLGVAPTAEVRGALRAARERVATRLALHDAVTRGDLPALAALASTGKLASLDRLEPGQALAVQRALAWPALQRALTSDDDVAIAYAADPALWRDEGALSPRARARVDLARNRLRWLDDVRAALRRRDSTTLRELLSDAPPEVEDRLTEVESRRILRVSMREAAVARLERALRDGPDREVVAALAEFESAGASFSQVLDWTAVRGVVDRLSLADALRAAAAGDPPDTEQLARLLPAARIALGAQGAPGEPDWATLERSVLRAAHLARLREALASDHDARIAGAANPDPYGARALLTPEERERVERALLELGQRRR